MTPRRAARTDASTARAPIDIDDDDAATDATDAAPRAPRETTRADVDDGADARRHRRVRAHRRLEPRRRAAELQWAGAECYTLVASRVRECRARDRSIRLFATRLIKYR